MTIKKKVIRAYIFLVSVVAKMSTFTCVLHACYMCKKERDILMSLDHLK